MAKALQHFENVTGTLKLWLKNVQNSQNEEWEQ